MKIGYQLYSAFENCKTGEGICKTIGQLAKLGYDGVEFFHYADLEPEKLKEVLLENKIEGFNAHVGLDRWENNLDAEILFAQKAGIPCLTIPWLAPELRNEQGYARLLKLIPKIASCCNHAGIKLFYHNHDFEFDMLDGVLVLDKIFEAHTNLNLQIDTFWAYYSGFDPVEVLKKYGTRIGYTHIKDYTDKTTNPPAFCAIGTGEMNNVPIIKECKRLQSEWLVVEQDNSKIDVMESAALSIQNLKRII